ncbi:MAG: tetratricopeptide repeat protein [Desulfobacterales bacterium]
MDPLETTLQHLAEDVEQIKWLMLAMLAIFLVSTGYLIYLFSNLRKLIKAEQSANDFRQKAKILLNMNDLDGVIKIASERLRRFPGELFAHWYLGQAYYRKKQWHKALAEFNYIYDIAPSWRQRFVNPFIIDIKDQLQSTKPEIIKG